MMVGIARIDRVVAELVVWLDGSLPFPKIRVKVLYRQSDYLALPNVAVRDLTSGEPDGISGLGCSIEEAVQDLLTRFIAGVRENTPSRGLTESDFVWSAPEDF
jgi:hypothetical protein